MKMLVTILSMLAAGAAQAHESLAPHAHPHGFSLLPDVNSIVFAVIVLAVGALALAQMRRG
jgi:Tfp pilus assembly protein PilV